MNGKRNRIKKKKTGKNRSTRVSFTPRKSRFPKTAIMIAMLFLIGFLFLLSASPYIFKSSKYQTIGHQILDIEKRGGFFVNNSHYLHLDNLIDKMIENIMIKLSLDKNLTHAKAIKQLQQTDFPENEAEAILEAINKTLVDSNFVHQKTQLLSLTLTGRKLDTDIQNIVNGIKNTLQISVENIDVASYTRGSAREEFVKTFLKENKNILGYLSQHINDDFYFTDCYNTTVIYLSIADVLNLPLYSVHIPNHSFLRWYIDEANYLNWEATKGKRSNDYSYTILTGIKLSDSAVKNGVYFRKLNRSENFGTRYILMGNVMIQTAEMQNSDKKVNYYNKALQYFNKALAANPNFSVVKNNIGIAYELLGNAMLKKERRRITTEYYDPAIDSYKEALSAFPRNQDIRRNVESLKEKLRE